MLNKNSKIMLLRFNRYMFIYCCNTQSQFISNNLPIYIRLPFFSLFLLVFASFFTFAEKTPPEIKFYQPDDVTNQIPYFDHRFRIDAELDEVTLIFYHKKGSKPVILIRPDGSKLQINSYPEGTVEWFDESTFDMIKIKKPMPGPWQAVGNILPQSEIMVVSDVRIEVAPLPQIIFTGETLKVTGKLFNGLKAIETPSFRNVVQLDVNFYSTNNAKYDNFGVSGIKLTTFRDNGRDLDEYKNDGVFTGEFTLTIPAGEWQPVYVVKLPMAVRELRQKPIVLHKSPVTLSVSVSSAEVLPHRVNFTIDDTYVDPNSLVFQGKMTFPDKQVEPFSIMEEQGIERVVKVPYTEPGVYRILVSVFGKTKNGREFRLIVPEFSFNVKGHEDNTIDYKKLEARTAAEQAIALKKKQQAEQAAKKRAAELALLKAAKEKEQMTLYAIIGGNVIVILLAVGGFFVWRKKNKAKAPDDTEGEMEI